MSLPKCPEPDSLIKTLVNDAKGEVSSSQIQLLNRLWPKESPLADLKAQDGTLEPNEVWDRAEAYMIKLCEPASL